jgi:hypothetical protein
MSRWIRVGINRKLLRKHLSQENGSAISSAQIDQWLIEAGFTQRSGDQWVVREADLGQLDPSEVTSARVEYLSDADRHSAPAKSSVSVS